MGVDYDGNFVCSGGMRVLPVWTSDPQSLCQQSEMQQQPSGNPFDQSSQPQQQQPAHRSKKTATAWLAGSRRCLVVINIVTLSAYAESVMKSLDKPNKYLFN